MDAMLNFMRDAVTVALFVLFIALVVWAWSPRRRQDFTAAANMPFDETDAVVKGKKETH